MVHRIDDDQKLPLTRLAVLSYLLMALVALLLLGFWRLQVLDSQHYAELADRNRIRTVPIIAPRGRILDRKGKVLLDNYPGFSVLLNRDSPELVGQHLAAIADGLGLDPGDLRDQVESAASLPRYQPLVIKSDASPADIAFVESHRADIPCLDLLAVHRRRYPANGYLAHVLGYVGEVSPEDIARSHGRYRPGDVVGKFGLEREYNDVLMGVDGSRRVIVDSRGRARGTLEETPAIPGKPIRLTIDTDLQTVAANDLGDKPGAVVALDPQTGEVLAMASRPAFDPNEFARGITSAEWKQLNDDPARPLLNRAIQAQLAPGSVFKIILAAAMLQSGVPVEDFTAFCPGSAVFYGRVFHCWDKKGHGRVNLHNAIVHSCDVFFYNVGMRLGIDRISYFAGHLGLGRRTGIDLPGEEPGLVPSEAWKERLYHQKWYPGETISVAIGQGATIVTPLQLAYSIGGIAMGGDFKQPHLLATTGPDPDVRFPLSQDTVSQLTGAMYGVVNEGGTAAASRLEGIEFCGKTGSAQVISDEGFHRAGDARKFLDNAWFVGFAPKRDPEIVVAVLVQGGEHGASAAAPVARDIIRAYYQEKSHGAEQYTDNEIRARPAEPAGVQ
ncbi:MAG TPA: penicillin-binding protein 2 [Candidatus Acidoferrales bacterium]|nr:penicillin-binding protein 2 [Candidatus Acidoferrales bacterium]